MTASLFYSLTRLLASLGICVCSGAPAKTIGKERRVREAMHQQALQLIGACETALSTHETQEAQVQDGEDGEVGKLVYIHRYTDIGIDILGRIMRVFMVCS